MLKAVGAMVLLMLVVPGCGKRETDAERRQREAIDLCYKAADCLKAKKNAEANSLFKQAIELDPFCEKARDGLVSMKTDQRAVDAATQIAVFKAAIQAYEMSVGCFPTTQQGLDALRKAPADLPNPQKWDGPYLEVALPLDPWSNAYQYCSPGLHNAGSYDVWSIGPDGISGTDDDIGNWQLD